MNEALKDYMKGFDLMGYRLRDGSHIIANEDRYDSAMHAFYVTAPVQVHISDDGKAFFSPWLITDEEEQIRILNINIVASDQLFHDDLDNLDNIEIDGGIFDDYTPLEARTLEWRKKWKPYDDN